MSSTTAAADQQQVACPVCGTSVTTSPVATFTSQHAADHFCPSIRDAQRNRDFRNVIERLWDGPTARVYECPRCTHGFAWPHVSGDERFYELLHMQAGYPTMRWEYRAFIDKAYASKADAPAPTHLDIGTGDGSFLGLLPTGSDKYAIESTEFMRGELGKKGIKTYVDVDAAIREMQGGFDGITMFQVIEHIADFKPLLDKCRQLLKPRGLLGMSVPSGSFKTTQERLTGCADMPPNHVNRWTPQSMTHACQQAGYLVREVVQQRPSWKSMVQQAGLKTLGAATTKPHSLSAQFYRVRNRGVRRALFSITGAVNLVSLLPHRSQIMQPQEFLCIAQLSS